MRKQKRKRFRKVVVGLCLLAVLGGTVAVFVSCGDDGSGKPNMLTEWQYPRKYQELVEKEARDNNVEEALVYAIMKTESGFDEEAVSAVGAVGLMQLMPDTFDWLLMLDGNPQNLTQADLSRPEVNVHYGCYLLSYLVEKYQDVGTLAASYNAGQGAVDGWLQDPQYSDDGIHLKNIPYPETAAYAEKVVKSYESYKAAYYQE